MKVTLLACAISILLTLTPDGSAADSAEDVAAAAPIVARMVDRAVKQQSKLRRYSAMRRYTLRNHSLSGGVSMTASLMYEKGKGKRFLILHNERVTGIALHVLRNLLKEEEELSRDSSSPGEINNSNYQFALVGKQVQDGRLCYRLKLIPRHKTKFLIAGDLWVDTREFAIVCVKGTPSRSPSFWISRPFVEQHFHSVNGFWMPSRTHSTAQVKLAGPTELAIDYWDYRFQPALS